MKPSLVSNRSQVSPLSQKQLKWIQQPEPLFRDKKMKHIELNSEMSVRSPADLPSRTHDQFTIMWVTQLLLSLARVSTAALNPPPQQRDGKLHLHFLWYGLVNGHRPGGIQSEHFPIRRAWGRFNCRDHYYLWLSMGFLFCCKWSMRPRSQLRDQQQH